LEATLTLEKGKTYYATQTVGGCTSATLAVTINLTLGNVSFDAKSFAYYTNSVKDILNFSHSSILNNVKGF
jgi:hypothetical protein